MRSKEVAALAGVSVRTLRHYHQLGVLPEPERASNGYRDYGLEHVARLLRVRRLAELGVPLERVHRYLDDPADGRADHDDAAALLDDLDRELAEQIARLEAQRERVRRLREARARPEVPAGLQELMDVVGVGALGAGVAGLAGMVAVERDAGLLVARLAEGPDGEADLAGYADGALRMDRERLAAVTARFAELPEAATDAPEAVAALAAELADLARPLLEGLTTGALGERIAALREDEVPDVADDPRLTGAQAAVLVEVGRLLGA
ncbi:MerR family transcriptional regulator [Nocardioides zeae]|uniref:MerR family transcriptional regulator n=1 Tax=Nocardioides imazamoxiresistens TaxID=3231893 RepID=A0ABU3PVG3_9ACTN|nr:MerR family transcriptional regulator [Nocardioides zeae]MDT9593210.1 MerR family transcriptional regulator [Nocardioides zeae]